MNTEIDNAKKSLGINSKTAVHYCSMCHGLWKCNCHECYDDKSMMCISCYGKYQRERGITEDMNSPPHLMQNEFG